MNSTEKVTSLIVERLKQKGFAQVPPLNRFGFVGQNENYIIVSREAGKDTKIYFKKLTKAIEAVRKDSKVYSKGPSSLRKYGLTHIESPLWALLHLLTLEELKA